MEILYSATKRRENINTATRMDLLLFLQSAMLGFELSCCYRITFLSNNSVFFSSKIYLFMLIYIHSSFTRLRMRGDLVITISFFSYLNFTIEGTKIMPYTGFPCGFLFSPFFWVVHVLVGIHVHCAVSFSGQFFINVLGNRHPL